MTPRASRRAQVAAVLLGLALSSSVAAYAVQTWAQLPVPEPAQALYETRTRDGALHLLFQIPGDGRVYNAITADAGDSWTVRAVSLGPAQAAAFDLTSDGSNRTLTHVFYASDGLAYARAVGDTDVWTRTVLDADVAAGATGIAVVSRADTLTVLYRKGSSLWLIRSTDDGTTWGTASSVISAGTGLLALTIDAAGTLHALFPDSDGRGPYYAQSSDAGASWTVVAVATATDPRGSLQSLIVEPGLLVAAYEAGGGVHAARSTDGGTTWNVERLADGAGAALALEQGGIVYLAWRGNDGQSITLAHSVDAHSWTREKIESAPSSAPRDALIAISGEAIFVPFVQFTADLVAAWNGGTPARLAPVDVTGDASESDVELSAWLETQWYEPLDDEWYFRYALFYRNAARFGATNVSIFCDAPEQAETVEANSWLPLSGMREPQNMTFGVGSLGSLSDGRAWLTVRVPGALAPGTELLFHAEMTNDSTENDTADNAVDLRHTVPLLAPFVASPPVGGQTCRSAFQIGGAAQPGVAVSLELDGAAAGEAEADAEGRFALALAGLTPGAHRLALTAGFDGGVSPAQELALTVDPTLPVDPVAIVLVDAAGRVQRLNDGQGQANLESGWRALRLVPGASYTLGIASCCPTDPALQAWSLTIGSGAAIALSYVAESGRFEGVFEVPAGAPSGSILPVTLSYRCAPDDPTVTPVDTGSANGMRVVAGRVYDAGDGKGIDVPVSGILCGLWNGRPAIGIGGRPTIAWVPWPVELFGDSPNPQETGADGFAPFYPPAGRYRWVGSDPARVYETYSTPSRVIVDGAFDPDVPLTVDEVLTRRIVVNDQPVSGRLTVSEGDVVEWVNADDRPHRVVSLLDPALGTGGWDSGEIPPGGRYRKVFERLGEFPWTDGTVGGTATIVAREIFVTPEAGTEGTTLTIRDEGFGNGRGKVEVGGTPCRVANWNDTIVTCTVREVLPPALYDVRVIPARNEERLYTKAFEVRPPVIRGVLPAVGEKGTRFRITGSYWGTKKGTVTIGDSRAKVSRWAMGPLTGDTVIEAKVPKLAPGTYAIVVEAPTGTVTLAGGFTVE